MWHWRHPGNRAPSPRGAVARPYDNMGNAGNCARPVKRFVQNILANTMRCFGQRSRYVGEGEGRHPDMSNQYTSDKLAYIDSLGRVPDSLVIITLVIEHSNSVSLAKDHIR